LAAALQLKQNDVVLGLAPTFHLVGYTANMMSLLMGLKTAHVLDPRVSGIAAQIAKTRGATVAVGTPTLARMLIRAGGEEGIPSLNRVILGAEQLKPDDEAVIRAGAPNAQVVQGYGATEQGVTFVEFFDPLDPKKRTLGQALPGVEYVVVDMNDRTKPVKKGEEGILLVRGPAVMTRREGYLGFVPDDLFRSVDGKEYYDTGDVVLARDIKNPSGENVEVVEFRGRLSRFSKVGGEMIPHEMIDATISDVIAPMPSGERTVVTVDAGGKPAAYVVGDPETGVVMGRDGKPIDLDTLNTTLRTRHDPKYQISEARVVPKIKLTSQKLDLKYYNDQIKKPHDGPALPRKI